MSEALKDIIMLVADKNMEASIRGILSRPSALGIRMLQADIYRHPQKDSGCRVAGVEFLNSFSSLYEHAILMFDYEGCGEEIMPAVELESNLKESLKPHWGVKADVVIIEPELDNWFWSDSPHVDNVIGWRDHDPTLRAWLQKQGFLSEGYVKPQRPKEALDAALRYVRKPRSSSLYEELAQKVSFQRCSDQAFLRLKNVLSDWFRRKKDKSDD